MPGLLELGRVIIGRGEAQAAVEHEGRFSRIDHEFAAGTVVDLPASVVTFERQIGQLLQSLPKRLLLRGTVTIRVACENGGAIFDHGSGGIVLLRAA